MTKQKYFRKLAAVSNEKGKEKDYPLMDGVHAKENQPSRINASRALRPIAWITCEIFGDNRRLCEWDCPLVGTELCGCAVRASTRLLFQIATFP